jgi:ABC-2 type transport system permease protein
LIKYFYTGYIAAQKLLVYKWNTWGTILNSVLMIIVVKSFWEAAYRYSVDSVLPLQWMVAYAGIAIVIRLLLDTWIEFDIERNVIDGTIVSDFLKPVNILVYYYSQALGKFIYDIFFRVLPLFVIVLVIFKFVVQTDMRVWLCFIISIFFSHALSCFLSLIVGFFAFWFHSVWGFFYIKFGLITFFSGIFVPLWFFPQGIRLIAGYLPFKAMYQIPLTIYVQPFVWDDVKILLMQQVVWCLIMIFLAVLIFRSGYNKLTVQGG